MKLTVTETDLGVVTVELGGPQLDANNAGTFKNAMKPVLNSSQLLLNLEHISFMDSSGLGALLSCLRYNTKQGGSLKAFGLTPQVRLLFELVRVHCLFDIFNTFEEAIRSFALPPSTSADYCIRQCRL